MFARVILLLAHFLAVAGETASDRPKISLKAGQCVTVDPISCNPDKLGTMKMDAIKKDTLLMVTGLADPGFYTITDVKTVTYTRCPESAVHASYEVECPKNDLDVDVGSGAILMSVFLSQICLGCYACCSRVQLHKDLPNVRLGVVAFTWMNKFWIAVAVSITVHLLLWMDGQLEQVVASFVLAAIVILFPFFVAAKTIQCCCSRCPSIREGCFVAFVGLYGSSWVMVAVGSAYKPENIAILGHHALLWGLFNFALEIPKSVAKHFVHDYFIKPGEKDVYIIGFSELAHPVLWLYQDVKRDAYKALLP